MAVMFYFRTVAIIKFGPRKEPTCARSAPRLHLELYNPTIYIVIALDQCHRQDRE